MKEKKKMITLVKAVQTAIACPSQWDAWDGDGNYYYLRYRYGYGEMCQYQSENWVDAPWRDDIDKSVPGWGRLANVEYIRTVAEFEHGDPLDGSISLEEFTRLAGVTLSPQIVTEGFGTHVENKLKEEFGEGFRLPASFKEPWDEASG
jgi:hypothetical protein